VTEVTLIVVLSHVVACGLGILSSSTSWEVIETIVPSLINQTPYMSSFGESLPPPYPHSTNGQLPWPYPWPYTSRPM